MLIQGFINYALSNPRNISGGGIRCPCKKCKNKKNYWSRYCNDASSTKKDSLRKIYVGMHTKNHMFLTIPW
jgi:hypothetical protein